MCLPPSVSKHPSKGLECPAVPRSPHFLCIWKRVPLGPTPPPSTQAMHLSSERTPQWRHECPLPKRHTFLPAFCFPLGQYAELKGEDGNRFPGPAQYMYSLTLLFGYETIKDVNFKCVMTFFFPACLHGHPF